MPRNADDLHRGQLAASPVIKAARLIRRSMRHSYQHLSVLLSFRI